MARAQRAEGGAAARLAARRRDAARGRTPARGTSPKATLRRSSSGGLGRFLRLVALMAAMAVIGFFAVLVVDVTAGLLGKVQVGEVSIGQLWDKVADRVLDRDVPRLPPERAAERPRLRPIAPARPSTPASPSTRAPLPAHQPEDDARHVAAPPRVDPQVEQAKKRLDDLLKRL